MYEKLPEQIFSFSFFFSNPGDKILICVKIYEARISECKLLIDWLIKSVILCEHIFKTPSLPNRKTYTADISRKS